MCWRRDLLEWEFRAQVLPMWQEDVRIELVSVSKSLDAPSSEPKPKALALCAHDVNANTVSVHVPVQAAALGTPQLRLYLPEIFSVQLDCHCDVAITDKLVGDVHVTAKLGDVVVNKLRWVNHLCFRLLLWICSVCLSTAGRKSCWRRRMVQ